MKPTGTESLPAKTSWERWDGRLNASIAYVSLAISTVLATVVSAAPAEQRAVTIAIAGLALVWVYAVFTRTPEPRADHQGRLLAHVAGLLVLATILMLRQPFFFMFAISGFFHAAALRPWSVCFVVVAATSALIQMATTGFPWPTVGMWVLFATIVVIQTLAIGFGIVISERLTKLSEQRRQTVVRLEAALEENAGLHRQLVEQAREAGVLDERGRMAREIHDTIAQGLTGIVTQLEAAAQAEDRPERRRRHVDNAVRLARESLAEARRSVENARPEALERAALPDALAAVARDWSAINEVRVDVTTTGEAVALHPEIEAALLRTAQEALANVAKHARASRVAVTLSFMGDVVALDVRDDGVGFDPAAGDRPATSFGLTAMRQRIGRVAGTLAIESEPGSGTAVSARVPAIGVQAS